jgi:predicted phosphoadenosine phosphosulfate sulfurtransferase
VCPPYGEEPLRGLWQYAQCWPHLWEKMIARVPGAATAGRYSQSPIYGFGDRRKSPPEGMTWQDAIKWEISKWPENQRAIVAARVREELNMHNYRTGGAPLKDYVSGSQELSWSYLLMIATRGDFKKRRTIMGKVREAADE